MVGSEGFCLPGFSSWLPDAGSMVVLTLVHRFLVKVPGCLYSGVSLIQPLWLPVKVARLTRWLDYPISHICV